MSFIPSCVVHEPRDPENCFLCASDVMAFNNSLNSSGGFTNINITEIENLDRPAPVPAPAPTYIYPELEPHMHLATPLPSAPVAPMYSPPQFTISGPIFGRDFYTSTFNHPVPFNSRFSPLSTHDNYSDRHALEPEEMQGSWARNGYFVEDLALDMDEGGRRKPHGWKRLCKPLSTFFPERIGWNAKAAEDQEVELISPVSKMTKGKPKKTMLPATKSTKQGSASKVARKKKPSTSSTVTRPLSPSPSPTVITPFESTDVPPKANSRKRKVVSEDEEEDTIFVTPIAAPVSKRQRIASVSSTSSLSELDSLFGDVPAKKKCKSGTPKAQAKPSKIAKKAKAIVPRRSTRKRAEVASYNVGPSAADSDADSDGDYAA